MPLGVRSALFGGDRFVAEGHRVSGPTRPDIWNRLARLESRCTVTIISTFTGDQRTGWQVKLRRRNGDGAAIRTQGATLLHVLEDAIHQADALGWLAN
jgi:hypothetical protein